MSVTNLEDVMTLSEEDRQVVRETVTFLRQKAEESSEKALRKALLEGYIVWAAIALAAGADEAAA